MYSFSVFPAGGWTNLELQLSQTTQECSDRTSLEDFMDYWTLISTQCLYVGLLPAGACSASGWSYSDFAIFMSVCAFVLLLQSGEAWECVNGGSWQVWLFRVSLFVRLLAAKGSKRCHVVLTTVEAQLSLHKRNITKAASEAWEWQETARRLATNKPRSALVTVLCVL